MGYPYQGITPDDYQRSALRTERTPAFVDHKPETSNEYNRMLARLIHGALGACTETGELQDMIKKHLIYNKPFDKVNVLETLKDCSLKRAAWAFGCSKKDSDEEARLLELLLEKVAMFTTKRRPKSSFEGMRNEQP